MPFLDFDIVPLLLAFLLGGLIGLEREHHGRPAGLRTHILVCVSSTMLILVSRDFAESGEAVGAARLVFDPNRMGAGIVTGIGFLGAGTVIRSGDFLRGLTTAACVWFVAGLGIVLGSHNYALGVFATTVVLFVLMAVSRFEDWLSPIIYRRLVVEAIVPSVEDLVSSIRVQFAQRRMRVIDIESGHFADNGRCELVFFLSLKKGFYAPELTETVATIDGVQSVRWRQIK